MHGEYMCPHCGSNVDTYPDPGGGDEQEYIEDCAICCHPNRIVATLDAECSEFEIQAFAET
jgi:hypothetical protein